MSHSPFLAGLFMGAGLIIAIGAQNAFVLTQAVRRNHAMSVAALCAFIDIVLIAAGVAGLGTLIAGNTLLKNGAALGGAAFLLWFGARSLREAFRPQSLSADGPVTSGLGPTLTATLAISLLNPHVYLDTVIMLGAISANFSGTGRYWFGVGAATASVIWFFSLSLAGTLLAPLLKRPRSWQVVNLLVCGMVWWIAYGLLRDFVTGLA